ncbi:MAG: TetR family transcriptional regulator [Williamsia herbipolensis]|uniref:TetR/AcrR family transcriptional regulator n=1 Tax=uncultured Williamsia sp. TaxID=259311 RepID=UPI0019E810C2|nr:TetR/AcrR family transcriptional regulator [uncultured Williamsia sp.]MBE7159789.1 TetR family transcriptional regulator [Williamsia herbipolensis]
MSSPSSHESTRRRLTDQQAETVRRLTEAAREVLHEDGFESMTVRMVAKRAGVAPATAYTYFSSKNHLVAELFWRMLVSSVPEPDHSLDITERAAVVLRDVALVVAGEEQLAGAVTVALLGSDPDVAHLRIRVGGFIRERLASALGLSVDTDDERVELLEMLYSGALVRAGMGYQTYSDIADRLAGAAKLLLEEHR